MSNDTNQQKIMINFRKSEFKCKCNSCRYSRDDIDIGELMDPIFLDKLQHMRTDVGKPFRINSGARCALYNESVGGVPISAHLVTGIQPACAADISMVGWSAAARYKFVKSAIKYNMWGIGIYKNFIHVDSKKKRKALWHGDY